jgi:hypothetical protein
MWVRVVTASRCQNSRDIQKCAGVMPFLCFFFVDTMSGNSLHVAVQHVHTSSYAFGPSLLFLFVNVFLLVCSCRYLKQTYATSSKLVPPLPNTPVSIHHPLTHTHTHTHARARARGRSAALPTLHSRSDTHTHLVWSLARILRPPLWTTATARLV